jgi:hypothetical protein
VLPGWPGVALHVLSRRWRVGPTACWCCCSRGSRADRPAGGLTCCRRALKLKALFRNLCVCVLLARVLRLALVYINTVCDFQASRGSVLPWRVSSAVLSYPTLVLTACSACPAAAMSCCSLLLRSWPARLMEALLQPSWLGSGLATQLQRQQQVAPQVGAQAVLHNAQIVLQYAQIVLHNAQHVLLYSHNTLQCTCCTEKCTGCTAETPAAPFHLRHMCGLQLTACAHNWCHPAAQHSARQGHVVGDQSYAVLVVATAQPLVHAVNLL